MQALLKEGAKDGPLCRAARSWDEKLMRLLLDRGAETSSCYGLNGKTLLVYTALGLHDKVIRLLLDTCRVDVEAEPRSGRIPPAVAAEFGREAVVRLLLDRGPVCVDNVMDAFVAAAKNGHDNILHLFLKTCVFDAVPRTVLFLLLFQQDRRLKHGS